MNLSALRTLVEVERIGSFVLAAERLAYTLPAVSVQLKKLEQELEIKLFDRKLRPPAITPAGRQVALHARNILAELDAIRAITHGKGGLEGFYRIGFISTANVRLMPHFLTVGARRFPKATFVVESGLSAELKQRVAEGDLDVALVTEAGDLGSSVEFHLVMEENFVVALPKRAETWGLERCASELTHVQLLQPASRIDELVSTRFTELGIAPKMSQRLDSVEAAMECVNAGIAFSVLPEPDVRRYANSSVVWSSEDIDFTRRIGLIARSSGGVHAEIEALMSLLNEAQEMASSATK